MKAKFHYSRQELQNKLRTKMAQDIILIIYNVTEHELNKVLSKIIPNKKHCLYRPPTKKSAFMMSNVPNS